MPPPGAHFPGLNGNRARCRLQERYAVLLSQPPQNTSAKYLDLEFGSSNKLDVTLANREYACAGKAGCIKLKGKCQSDIRI